MDNVSIIDIDISKSSFQVHGATSSGEPALRKKLSRGKVLEFLAPQPPCLVVMETCGGAHHWGREIQPLGHKVRLIAPMYVKAFAKHHSYQDTSLRYSKSKIFLLIHESPLTDALFLLVSNSSSTVFPEVRRLKSNEINNLDVVQSDHSLECSGKF